MIRITRDVLRSWFPKEGVFSNSQLEKSLQVIIEEFRKDFCLQEILDISFKVFFHDVEHDSITRPFYVIFQAILSKLNLNLWDLNEQCVVYNIPENLFLHRHDRLQITISRVVRFYAEHVNKDELEKLLYDVCKKEIYPFSSNFKDRFSEVFESTVDFYK